MVKEHGILSPRGYAYQASTPHQGPSDPACHTLSLHTHTSTHTHTHTSHALATHTHQHTHTHVTRFRYTHAYQPTCQTLSLTHTFATHINTREYDKGVPHKATTPPHRTHEGETTAMQG